MSVTSGSTLPLNLAVLHHAAAFLATAMTLTIAGMFRETTGGVMPPDIGWQFLSRAGQVNPWTRARRRLIERIRLADRRMAGSLVVWYELLRGTG